MNRIAAIFSAVLCFSVSSSSQRLDISGWKLVQTNYTHSFVIPPGTIIPVGGYVIIARNAAQASFETFWNKKLDPGCVFLNTAGASDAAPQINGDETFSIQNSSGQIIDGPTVPLPPQTLSGKHFYQRISALLTPGVIGSWTNAAVATPGSGMTNTGTGKVVIGEIADDAASGASIYEFVELYYDVAGPATGQGTAAIAPTRFAFNQTASIQIAVTAQTDTLRALRCIKPAMINWSTPTISTQADAPVILVTGDTVTVTNLAIAPAGIATLSLPGVTAIDTTSELTFAIQTSTDGATYAPIKTQPKTIVYGSPRPISQVKAKITGVPALLGKWAVVRGTVTVAREFGGPSYIQDATGGLAVYDSSVTNSVQRGDDIIVLGLVAPYNELFELTPAVLLGKKGAQIPVEPIIVSASQILSQDASEPYEGRLVRMDNISSVTTLAGAPISTWAMTVSSGTNYLLTDATGAVQTRISPKISLVDMPTPSGVFDMVGVLGQYKIDFQLMPRSSDDILLESGTPKILTAAPYESEITSTALTFTWKTDLSASSVVRYGASASYGAEAGDSTKVTDHRVTLRGLWPGTVYHAQLVSTSATAAAQSGDLVVSTASGSSSGSINVYFNKTIDPTVSIGEIAQTVSMTKKIIARIDAAQYSIDMALYSLSGAVGDSIAAALLNARNRGVKIRFICETDNDGSAAINRLVSGGVYKINDSYDLANQGLGLMHNKFFVFDNRDTTSDKDDWVWMGSWNPTDPGTNSDMQDAMEIQDKALANAYTLEFNEMWGSATDSPNQAASRFGARKTDNTPHLFTIGGRRIESYFSPSDKVTNHIVTTLSQAATSINLALLTLTRSDIADLLLAKKQAGVNVHGVVDNATDQGTQITMLQAQGIDFLVDPDPVGLLHHKYAIVDANAPAPGNAVIAGSHNWSAAAETANNENTLIVYGARVANLYYQEFKSRYMDSGGKGSIVLGVQQKSTEVPSEFRLMQNYPNPFNPATTIGYEAAASGHLSITVFDVLGREVAVLVDKWMQPGTYTVHWNAQALPSGVYIYRLRAGAVVLAKKLLLQK
jgi:phosphatidylserine/phosphatidylglycerophosphate/cardiolipin synthase-like enzyme